jgi:hypothetical protein
MDRLPFASEGVLSEVADMYPASHEGVFYKLFFHRGILRCWFGLRPRRSSRYGRALPCKPHIRREDVPTTIPHSGRESSKWAAPLCETARSCQAGQRRRPLGSVSPRCFRSEGSTSEADQHAGFMTAPSGTTPWVANRHKAIRSRRAIATTITLRMRRPVPAVRSRNQLT